MKLASLLGKNRHCEKNASFSWQSRKMRLLQLAFASFAMTGDNKILSANGADVRENETMIKLNDLLKFTDEQISKAKVRFLINSETENPIELYKNDPDKINKKWLYWRNTKRFFNEKEIAICLVRLKYDQDSWLLTTIDTVDSELNVTEGINYEGTPFAEYKDFYGRTIVKYHKATQSDTRIYKDVSNELEVSQILPDIFDDDNFSGYDKVKLSYTQLKNILERGKSDWIGALENQKGVYLITDKSNGKFYVGSATSDNGMLLQRWRNYADNGHGENIELKKIVDEKGFDYVKSNFQYSILENYNSKVPDEIILERESWWKDILLTRKFGYNAN